MLQDARQGIDGHMKDAEKHCQCQDVMQVGKEHATTASQAPSAAAAEAAQEAGLAAIEKVLKQDSKGEWFEAKRLSAVLRKVPEIDLFVPTVRSSTCKAGLV